MVCTSQRRASTGVPTEGRSPQMAFLHQPARARHGPDAKTEDIRAGVAGPERVAAKSLRPNRGPASPAPDGRCRGRAGHARHVPPPVLGAPGPTDLPAARRPEEPSATGRPVARHDGGDLTSRRSWRGQEAYRLPLVLSRRLPDPDGAAGLRLCAARRNPLLWRVQDPGGERKGQRPGDRREVHHGAPEAGRARGAAPQGTARSVDQVRDGRAAVHDGQGGRPNARPRSPSRPTSTSGER